jgi:hypothetical protein
MATGAGRRKRRAHRDRELDLHLGPLARDHHGRNRPLSLSPRPLSAPAQRNAGLRCDRLRLLRPLPRRAAAPCRPDVGGHRHASLGGLPRTAAAWAHRPVRGVSQPALRVEPRRRRRCLGRDEARRDEGARGAGSPGHGSGSRVDGESLHRRRLRSPRDRACRSCRRSADRRPATTLARRWRA